MTSFPPQSSPSWSPRWLRSLLRPPSCPLGSVSSPVSLLDGANSRFPLESSYHLAADGVGGSLRGDVRAHRCSCFSDWVHLFVTRSHCRDRRTVQRNPLEPGSADHESPGRAFHASVGLGKGRASPSDPPSAHRQERNSDREPISPLDLCRSTVSQRQSPSSGRDRIFHSSSDTPRTRPVVATKSGAKQPDQCRSTRLTPCAILAGRNFPGVRSSLVIRCAKPLFARMPDHLLIAAGEMLYRHVG